MTSLPLVWQHEETRKGKKRMATWDISVSELLAEYNDAPNSSTTDGVYTPDTSPSTSPVNVVEIEAIAMHEFWQSCRFSARGRVSQNKNVARRHMNVYASKRELFSIYVAVETT